MGILTKIFVVLVAVLSVALAAFTATYVKNNATVKQDHDTLKAQLVRADSAAAIATQAKARLEASFSKTRGELDAEIGELRDESSDLSGQLKVQVDKNAALQSDVDMKGSQLQQAIAGSEQQAAIIATLRDELKEARSKQLKFERSATELTDALQRKSTELDTAVENIRLLKENIADLQTQLEESRTQTTAVAAGPDLPIGDVPQVRGLITAVKMVGEDLFVSVNVGSNDSVAPGMEFMIHRDDAYLGSLEISKVDLNSSAGRVTLKTGEIVAGLEITASF